MAKRMLDNKQFLCRDEHSASLKCLTDSNGDKDSCAPFFAAYKACLKRDKRERMRRNAGRNMAGVVIDADEAAAAKR